MENNQSIIEKLISWDESISFETKRVSGKMVRKALETIVAFANTKGGFLVLGMEDYSKAKGTDRLIGIKETRKRLMNSDKKYNTKLFLL